MSITDTQHYLEFRFLCDDSEIGWVSSKICKIIHHHCHNGASLALSLPQMAEKCIGRLMRIFGTEADLEAFSNDQNFDFLIQSGSITSAPVRCIPETTGFAVYRRERSIENRTGSSKAKRRQRLMDHLKKQNIDINKEKIEKGLAREHVNRPTCYLMQQSRCNGQRFSISVSKETVTEPQPGQFTGYGLSRHGATVPEF